VSAKDNPEFGQDPEEFIVRQMAHFLKARLQDFVLISFFFHTRGPSHASTGVNIAPRDYLANAHGGFLTMVAHPT
jgi:hypothetical protein